MKFWEAMKALEEGKKVRCTEWLPALYIDLSFFKENDGLNAIECSDFKGDWELYKEPEPTFSSKDSLKAAIMDSLDLNDMHDAQTGEKIDPKSWVK